MKKLTGRVMKDLNLFVENEAQIASLECELRKLKAFKAELVEGLTPVVKNEGGAISVQNEIVVEYFSREVTSPRYREGFELAVSMLPDHKRALVRDIMDADYTTRKTLEGLRIAE